MKIKVINIEPIDLDDYVYCSLFLNNIYIPFERELSLEDNRLEYRVVDDTGNPAYISERRIEVIDESLNPGWELFKNEHYDTFVYPELTKFSVERYYDYEPETIWMFQSFMKENFIRTHGGIEAIEVHPASSKSIKDK